MKLLTLLVAALILGGAASMAGAEDLRSLSSERGRIESERAAAEARYAGRMRSCEGRFVVTSCVEEARRERRDTLTRLRREQNQIDDAMRKARAAERTEAIRKREASEAQRARDATPREPRQPAQRATPEPRTPRTAGTESHDRPNSAGAGVPPGSAPSPEQRRQQEARSRATFDAAQRAAEAHRLEVESRNAERAAKHKPAAPLPVPGAASAP